jgi:hypothetical protein
VQKAVRGFSKVASELELVVDENRDSIRDFSSGGLYELSQFIAEGRVLISALTRLSAQIERDPHGSSSVTIRKVSKRIEFKKRCKTSLRHIDCGSERSALCLHGQSPTRCRE